MDRLINENAVLSAIGEWIAHNEHTYTNATEYLRNRIKAIKTAEQEPCDCISRKSLKHKLQEHHDFFVNAYGGFSNLPPNDKSRVDEITNCIAMVVNEPSIQPKPKTAHWISKHIVDDCNGVITWYECSECGRCVDETITEEFMIKDYPYCHCGAKMLPTDSEKE